MYYQKHKYNLVKISKCRLKLQYPLPALHEADAKKSNIKIIPKTTYITIVNRVRLLFYVILIVNHIWDGFYILRQQ